MADRVPIVEAELVELSRSDKEIKLYLKIPMNWLGLSANFPFFSGIQLFGRQRQKIQSLWPALGT